MAVELKTPPPFGYGVGSVIRHQGEIYVQSPWRLDAAQLPAPGPVNAWLEIRRFSYVEKRDEAGIRYLFRIDYQIFPSLHQITTLEIPSLALALISPTGERQTIALPPWRFTANPLIPPQWRDAQVEIRPLWQPEPPDPSPHLRRLAGITAALLLLGSILAWYHRRLPWQQPPFTRALGQIRKAVRHGQAEAAFRAFHQALNATAGKALSAWQLPDFLRQRPAFVPLQDDLQQFFEDSQRLFFSRQSNLHRRRLTELERLCRACAEAERRCRK